MRFASLIETLIVFAITILSLMDKGDKNRFLYKLIPPRANFALDMTENERKVMQEHANYWKDLTDRGTAIVFGPVLDPKGAWGIAIVEVTNEQDARILGKNDPVYKEDK